MMSERKPEIVVAGHICLDVLPVFETQQKIEGIITPGKLIHVGPALMSVGGAVANTGIALHRLGIETCLIGKIGNDLFGQAIQQLLKQTATQLTEHMLVDPDAESSYSIVISPPGRDRTFLHHPGVNDSYHANDIPLEQASSGYIFHFGYPPLMQAIYSDGGEALAQLCANLQAAEIVTSLDMALPDAGSASGKANWLDWLKRTLPFVDIFAPSDEEIRYMLGYDYNTEPVNGEQLARISAQLLDMGVALVILKLGEHGLYLRTTNDAQRLQHIGKHIFIDWKSWQARELFCPCFCVQIAGTTGAGDCTIAGLLAAMVRHAEPEEALLTATAVGAYSVEGSDATGNIPELAAVQQRIRQGWQQQTPRIQLTGWQQLLKRNLWSGPFDSQR